MRDPARIDRVLAIFRELWTRDPDFRFMQLMSRELGDGDHFYLEDDDLMEIMKRSLSNMKFDRR